MTDWAGIKHAINSTIGTKKFKPLDEVIAKTKTLVASDNLYYPISSGTKSFKYPDTSNITLPKKFVAATQGSVKIKGSINPRVTYHDGYVTFYLKKNGVVVNSFKAEYAVANEYLSFEMIVDFDRGDELTFSINANLRVYNVDIYYKDIAMYGDVVDTIFYVEEA